MIENPSKRREKKLCKIKSYKKNGSLYLAIVTDGKKEWEASLTEKHLKYRLLKDKLMETLSEKQREILEELEDAKREMDLEDDSYSD